ncbi:MAG: L-proline glycine betaine ABC transport system permease protein ProV, partial [uncultured Thermomicrobiales bacterium]
GLADRYPRQLSGGQQQRVGVARALAADPPIVLMDEPFGALDPVTRKQLQRELRRIQAEVRKTIVFVTHDIGEAFLLGDRVVLMRDGRVVQNGAPAELLRNPADPFVSSFIGEDRALHSLQYTTLAEIAGPAVDGRLFGVDGASPILPGHLSVLEGLRFLGTPGRAIGDGIRIGDEQGRPVGFLSLNDLVATLGMTLAADDGEAHAVPD